MFSLIKNEKGFSYAEILVAVVILGLVFNSAFFIYERGIAWWNQGDKEIEVQQSLRIVMDRLTKDLRMATINSLEGNLVEEEIIEEDPDKVKLHFKDYISFTVKTKVNNSIISEKRYYEKTSANRLLTGKVHPLQPLAENIFELYVIYDKHANVVTVNLSGTYDGVSSNLESRTYLRVE